MLNKNDLIFNEVINKIKEYRDTIRDAKQLYDLPVNISYEGRQMYISGKLTAIQEILEILRND